MVNQGEEKLMNTRNAFITLGLVLASVIAMPAARASDYDQASKLTFSQSVQIPGQTLPAGTYLFVLADTTNSRDIVEIFNSDRTKLYATVFTVGATRVEPTDNTAITFAERDQMQPETIVSWFYPGDDSGHQFLYSKMQEQELAQVKHYTVVATAQHKSSSGVNGY
jgi:hypothetical protein